MTSTDEHRPTTGRGGVRAEHHALALDLGSSSVRAVLGSYRQGTVSTEEVYRLHHQAVDDHGTLTWDLERIMDGVRRSIVEATRRLGRLPDSIGIDTWGVDYGLLDARGALLRAPRAYRDRRMSRWAADLDRAVTPQTAWRETGILPQQINTVYQLYADLREDPDLVERVDRFLPLPDLVAHLLGAPAEVGRAIASTTGLASPGAHHWSSQVMGAAGVPERWMPPLVDDATVAGTTSEGVTIVRPGGHDTACAVHALGLADDEVRLFISSGSWSLIGATVPRPVLDEAALRAGLTNEVRTDGGIRLLRNLTGFWLLQECQRSWNEPDTGALVKAAGECASLGVVIDPDDELFAAPGDMPDKIADWCRLRYKVEPEGPAQTVRLILESLACAHAAYAQGLQDVVGDLLDRTAPIHLVGGGARNSLLPAMTAAACHRRVVVGTPEASALGNILAQLEAVGVLDPAARGEVLRRSVRPVEVGACQSMTDPASFDAMRERLLNATAR
ncbi:carbohydrate kinase [Actinomyces viscosus]|uniref:Rhamnulokinase n=1 Tax=Actinomyces viscosus TaxID=1656 RepID=A0A448PHU3_ACTVI|nr:FGGY-family carbohydrate kinase [Actinomyces viscosus]TFH53504.1 carbohydrate kinase [Actinomyces viscosus]VEI14541.1 Rhamnulokinase [Actinomyces viscosus]